MLTGLHAIDDFILSLGLVTLGDNGWYITTGLRMTMLRLHLLSRHIDLSRN